MKSREQKDEEQRKMRERLAGKVSEPVATPAQQDEEKKYKLSQAAKRLGVSYATAGRLLIGEPGVKRYSGTMGNEAVFPTTKLKRHQRVRMTWIIPETAIQSVLRNMCVRPLAAG
jgi:hypothetical protein